MTRLLFILVFFAGLGTALGQRDTNLLTYKDSIYYSEKSIITSAREFTLYQDIYYNVPGTIDEEFVYTLTLVFIMPKLVHKRRVLDLASDTAIVKSKYGVFSVWNWSDENNLVSGRIEILEWRKRKVTIKENISVWDKRRNKRVKFIGTRTFTRQKGW